MTTKGAGFKKMLIILCTIYTRERQRREGRQEPPSAHREQYSTPNFMKAAQAPTAERNIALRFSKRAHKHKAQSPQFTCQYVLILYGEVCQFGFAVDQRGYACVAKYSAHDLGVAGKTIRSSQNGCRADSRTPSFLALCPILSGFLAQPPPPGG